MMKMKVEPEVMKVLLSLIWLMLTDLKKSILTRKLGLAILKVRAFSPLFNILNIKPPFVEYVKKVKAKLEEQGKTERIPSF